MFLESEAYIYVYIYIYIDPTNVEYMRGQVRLYDHSNLGTEKYKLERPRMLEISAGLFPSFTS